MVLTKNNARLKAPFSKKDDIKSHINHQNPQLSWKCVTAESLPNRLKDNIYIQASHRPLIQSKSNILCSMFRLHNETGNIWTHLSGLVLYITLLIFTSICNQYDHQPKERFMLTMYLVTCIFLFCTSTTFHTFTCSTNDELYNFLRK